MLLRYTTRRNNEYCTGVTHCHASATFTYSTLFHPIHILSSHSLRFAGFVPQNPFLNFQSVVPWAGHPNSIFFKAICPRRALFFKALCPRRAIPIPSLSKRYALGGPSIFLFFQSGLSATFPSFINHSFSYACVSE